MAVCQNLVPLVNPKIAGKWMFIPLELIIIGFDPPPDLFIIHQAFEKHWDTIYFQQGSFYLVGGLAHFYFSIQLGRIIPTDELIFFRGVAQPPTSYDCYGNLIPLCTTGLSTPPLRRRFLRQRLAVQISIDLELFLVWSRLIFFKHSWEMLGMWGKLMEMSTMLASIVLFMFFFPPQRLLKIGPKWGWSCYQPNESGQIWRAVVWRTARDQMIWDVWNILKYTYIIIYIYNIYNYTYIYTIYIYTIYIYIYINE